MSRPEEIENLLEECLERLLTGGETIEQCLQSHPAYADELKPLLVLALAAKQVSEIQPRPEFRERARRQFDSALRVTEPERSRPVFRWSLRWVAVASTVLALLLAGSGTVVASNSMPDELLYPVKMATEQVRLLLTPTTLGKIELYSRLADERVTEIARMADENNPEQIELTTERLDAHLTRIAALALPRGTVEGGDEMLAATTAEAPVAPQATQAPAPPKATVPEAVPPAPETPPVTLTIPATPAEAPPGPPPAPGRTKADSNQKTSRQVEQRAEIKATVMNQASDNSARLRALLETTPESARPALLRAIAVSEAGYEKALAALDKSP